MQNVSFFLCKESNKTVNVTLTLLNINFPRQWKLVEGAIKVKTNGSSPVLINDPYMSLRNNFAFNIPD